MIFGIGTDLVEVARIRRLLQRHPETAPRRILATDELADFQASPEPARFLAKRFAVKEALGKALGTGLRAPVLLTAISTVHDNMGKPMLSFSPPLQALLHDKGITACHLSISDEQHYTMAFVVLEGERIDQSRGGDVP